MSSTLVLGHATGTTAENVDVKLAAAVIAVGGRGDSTSSKVQPKLSDNYALGFAGNPTDPIRIEYPASYLFQTSVDDGVPKLTNAIPTTGAVRVVSYSEGTLVAEQVKRNFAADPTKAPSTNDLSFVFIASPYVPNGGLFARFPGFTIPGLLPTFSAAQPTGYSSTYVTNEYDGFADFPAYFNVLSIANAIAGMGYAHPDEYYDAIDLANQKTYTSGPIDNGKGGQDTYILVYNPHLPLLAPIRQIASMTGLTPLTEPGLAAIEPMLLVMVDAGYTDRTNANPATPTAFSFVTPPAKIAEAMAQMPTALAEGMKDMEAATKANTTPSSKLPTASIAPKVAPTVTPNLAPRGIEVQQAPEQDPVLKQDPAPKDIDARNVSDLKAANGSKDGKNDPNGTVGTTGKDQTAKRRSPNGFALKIADALKIKPPVAKPRTQSGANEKGSTQDKSTSPSTQHAAAGGEHASKPAA